MPVTNVFSTSLSSAALQAGILTIDVSTLNEQIQGRLARLSSRVDEMLSEFSQPQATEAKMFDVTAVSTAMEKVGEFNKVSGHANRQAVEIDFPLWKFQRATGWTYDFLRLASVQDFQKAFLDAEYAYFASINEEIKAAVYNNVRREFTDKFGRSQRTGLIGYPFWNADGMVIPPSLNGATFTAATHSHYNGTSGSTLSVYDIDTLLINNVVEHGDMIGIALYTTPAVASTMAGLTDLNSNKKFLPVLRPNTAYSTAANRDTSIDNLDSDPDNKLLGHWDGFPVYARSWCPASTIACIATGAREKALGIRRDGNLTPLAGVNVQNILTATDWLAYFGAAVNNRSAGAVLDTAHQTTYTAPTLTL
jgi:hypothetical protein